MIKPAIPSNEITRLEALHSLEILDTLPDERFDRLTRMAKRMFNVPIALVSLVDENRQWFKSCVGLDAQETPRDISFCGHAILGDGVFVIEDALEDMRFADNPLVTGDPKVRFYAGCPLRSLNGSKLGTLCIIDQEPRAMSESDLSHMKDLASMVEHEMAAIEMATLDTLTGITNRRGFMMVAEHSLNFFKRQEIPASLVFLDLNDFKSINDTFGHAEGDKALVAFAGLMQTVFRDSDVFARLGGDEFVVLLTGTPIHIAENILKRFQTALDTYNREVAAGHKLSYSCGVVAFDPAKHATVKQLLSEGDQMMYQAKKSLGRV